MAVGMGSGDLDYLSLQNLSLSPEALQEIAGRRPDLAAQVLAHPNIYPELSEWLLQVNPELAGGIPAHGFATAPQASPAVSDPGQAHALPDAGATFQSAPLPPQLPVPASPLPVAQPASPSGPHTPKRGLLIGAVAAGLVLVACVGFGLWWFLGSSSSSEDFAHAPGRTAQADLRTMGEAITLKPIGADRKVAVHSGTTAMVAFTAGDDYFLAGMDPDSDSGLPLWVVPTGDPAGAELVDGWYFTDDGAYKITEDAAVPEEEAGTPPTRPDPTEPEEDADAEDTHEPITTIELGTTPTEDVPYAVDADTGELFGENNEPIAQFTDPTGNPEEPEENEEDTAGESETEEDGDGAGADEGPRGVFALAPNKGDIWVISNGNNLIGVRGNDVVWEVKLPPGSATVNGFDTESGPTWSRAGNTLLVGTPSGILALDTNSGEETWRIDTPVTNWQAAEGVITVLDGTKLSVFDEAASNEDQDSSQPEVPAALTAEQIMNVEVEVPQACAENSGLSGSTRFEDGYADGTNGPVTITGSAEILVDGQIATAIVFNCNASRTMMAEVGVYSPGLDLIGAPELISQDRVASYAQEVKVRGQGSELLVLAEDFSEERIYIWDGQDFALTYTGEPSDNWDGQGNGQELEPQARGLEPEDLANITLTLPVLPGVPDRGWETVTLVDYVHEYLGPNGDTWANVILEDSIVPGTVNGVPYLFFTYGTQTIGFMGSVCAISPTEDVACADFPPDGVGTDHVWTDNIAVDGDIISYDLTSGASPHGRVWQRFDGEDFTLVDYE